MTDRGQLLDAIVALAEQAGVVLMEHYRGELDVRAKADASPVTVADEAAEALILGGLRQLTPDILIVAEEEVAAGRAPAVDQAAFWLVDPLDGTKEFIHQRGEFTVNIALIEGRVPVLGVVVAPAIDKTWWGAVGDGAMTRSGETRGPIGVRAARPGALVAVASRSHSDAETEKFLDEAGVVERTSAGSSLKFCLVAEGKADLYPRFGPTMEWDTAAGHAVLAAAGGSVTMRDGQPFLYRKPEFRNPGFIARGA